MRRIPAAGPTRWDGLYLHGYNMPHSHALPKVHYELTSVQYMTTF